MDRGVKDMLITLTHRIEETERQCALERLREWSESQQSRYLEVYDKRAGRVRWVVRRGIVTELEEGETYRHPLEA
jgi:hypothetical protein